MGAQAVGVEGSSSRVAFTRPTMARVAPAAEKNKVPIWEVFEPALSAMQQDGAALKVLEIATGTGQHAAYFAANFPELVVQPTDMDLHMAASVAAHAAALKGEAHR